MSVVLRDRLARIRERVAAACARSGRDDAQDIRIVAVTKQVPLAMVRDAYDSGFDVFGENRIQEAQGKALYGPPGAHWHMVGRLQSNKARQAVLLFDMIHSIDSDRLLERVSRTAIEEGRIMDVLLQVNTSNEPQKAGAAPSEVRRLVDLGFTLKGVRIKGFMTIGPLEGGPEAARRCFALLRGIGETLAAEYKTRFSLLSMGMSDDFEVAVEEGATLLRLGTAIFGRRPA